METLEHTCIPRLSWTHNPDTKASASAFEVRDLQFLTICPPGLCIGPTITSQLNLIRVCDCRLLSQNHGLHALHDGVSGATPQDCACHPQRNRAHKFS